MAKLACKPTIELNVTLSLTESEVHALDALFGFDADEFLKVFYAGLGRSYLEPHEAGFRLLHKTIRGLTGPAMGRVARAREMFAGEIHEQRSESVPPAPELKPCHRESNIQT